MSTAHTSPAFSSVKLPRALLVEAKHTAQAMRRSTAGQIEYWAMLGKAVEDGGLTTREAANALGLQDGGQPTSRAATSASALDAIEAQFEHAEANGSLAERMREIVLANRTQTTPAHAMAA
jgi:hypothetical protein